jgi:hypothetical protein
VAELYADRNIRGDVRLSLRALGHVVTTTDDLRLERATDDVQLLTAAERGWILLTNNERDFVLLHDAWHLWSAAWGVAPQHAGIVIPKQGWSMERATTELGRLLETGVSFTNALYQWHGALGWFRRVQAAV